MLNLQSAKAFVNTGYILHIRRIEAWTFKK